MEKINEIFTEYFKTQNTDYAILINGVWGSGKTHYLKKTLKTLIEGTGLKFLYVSLSGYSSINQIERDILLNYAHLTSNNKLVYYTVNKVGKISEFLTKILTKGDLSLDVTSINLISLLNFNNHVVVFDDLERMNKKLDIDEVLGFINSTFVEHNKVKVIIVGDITKFDDETMKLYSNRKEKLIGREITFNYTINKIVDIILEKYKNDISFHMFLSNNITFIKAFLEDNELYNLRIVFFTTEMLKQIYLNFINNDEETTKRIMLFTFAICREFKLGSFVSDEPGKRQKLIEMQNSFGVYSALRALNQEQEREKSFDELFANRYYSHLQLSYRFFQSIYDSIVHGFYDQNLLLKEIKTMQNVYNYALDKLSDHYILEQDKINEYYAQVCQGIDTGHYSFYSLPYVFTKMLPLINEEIIPLANDVWKNMITNAMQTTIARDFSEKDYEVSEYHASNNKNTEDVIKYMRQLHNKQASISKMLKVNEIIIELQKQNADYSKLFHSFLTCCFSQYLTVEEIITAMKGASNYSLTKFSRFMAEKYNYDLYATITDYDFIKCLKSKIVEDLITNEVSNNRIAVYKNAQQIFERIITEFEKKNPDLNFSKNQAEITNTPRIENPMEIQNAVEIQDPNKATN